MTRRNKIPKRRQRAGTKGTSAKRHHRNISKPRSAKQFFAKSQEFQDTWISATHVVSKMRADRVSLRQASREYGVGPQSVLRLAGSALRRRSNGQYGAKKVDHLLRVLVVPTASGLQEIAVRDSRESTKVGKYSDALQTYLNTGDASALARLRNRTAKLASGKRFRLLTDLEEIDRQANFGNVSYQSLYARST